MDEELVFQYPVQDENGEGVNAEIERLMNIRRKIMLKTRVIFVSILLAICVLYTISYLSSAIPVIIIILLIVLFFFGKVISGGNNTVDYYTEISAYECFVDLKITNISNGNIQQATIYYDEIEWAMMSRSLERIQICFSQNNSEMYDYSVSNNRFEQSNSLSCLIDIPLNPYTYQQYYFLYVAGDYFKIRIPKTLNNDKIIIKKYGYSDDYITKIR